MISLNIIQEELIDLLKADATLVASVGTEIRENQWQGKEFSYPNVRLRLGRQAPTSRGTCYTSHGSVPFDVLVASKEASSQEADRISGEVVEALLTHQINNGTYMSGPIRLGTTGIESAARLSEDYWVAVSHFEINVYEQNS